jgi:hypothetical protein
MNTRFAIAFATVLTLLGTSATTGLAQNEGALRGGESASAKLDSTTLRVQSPVNVHGPFPTLLREVEVGDVVQLQVFYPIAPPFPDAAMVKVSSRALTALLVTSNEGEVAVLGPEPKQGLIGSGYLSAYVRANNAGEASAVVTVTYPGGAKKEVPFQFKINPRGEGRQKVKAGQERAQPALQSRLKVELEQGESVPAKGGPVPLVLRFYNKIGDDQKFTSGEYQFAVLDKDGGIVEGALGIPKELREIVLRGRSTTDKPGVSTLENKLVAGEEYYLVVSVRNLVGHLKFTAK